MRRTLGVVSGNPSAIDPTMPVALYPASIQTLPKPRETEPVEELAPTFGQLCEALGGALRLPDKVSRLP